MLHFLVHALAYNVTGRTNSPSDATRVRNSLAFLEIMIYAGWTYPNSTLLSFAEFQYLPQLLNTIINIVAHAATEGRAIAIFRSGDHHIAWMSSGEFGFVYSRTLLYGHVPSILLSRIVMISISKNPVHSQVFMCVNHGSFNTPPLGTRKYFCSGWMCIRLIHVHWDKIISRQKGLHLASYHLDQIHWTTSPRTLESRAKYLKRRYRFPDICLIRFLSDRKSLKSVIPWDFMR